MAYSANGLAKLGSNFEGITTHRYETADAIATVIASGYFTDEFFSTNDLIYVIASDGQFTLRVTDGAAGNTITTDYYYDASNRCIFSDIVDTVAGTVQTITVTGAATTDVVQVSYNVEGASFIQIEEARVTAANTVSISYASDPGTTRKLNLNVFKGPTS